MSKINGITYGTYPSIRPKKNVDKSVCENCYIRDSIKYQKADSLGRMHICRDSKCDKCYFSQTSKATVILGRDTITGKELKKTFVADTEEEALKLALDAKLNLDKNGGPRIINKSTLSIIDIATSIYNEDYKLHKIGANTNNKNMTNIRMLKKEAFATKPINKVKRIEIINYLDNLAKYSKTTIKERFRIIRRSFEYAYSQNIIRENFMEGYNAIEKPKPEVIEVVPKKIALTMEKERQLIEYLESTPIYKCKHKNLFLLLLATGMRIGEALSLDYKKDIDLENKTITVYKTITKGDDGKDCIGLDTKTPTGRRIIHLSDIALKYLKECLENVTKNKFNLLFYNPKNITGGFYKEGTINSAIKRIAFKLDIYLYVDVDGKTKTQVHTHMLRGTFATRCAEAKMPPIVLQKILGHADIDITNKYYIDVDQHFIDSENKNFVNYMKEHNLFNEYYLKA